MPRWSSSSSAASAGGLLAPPPDIGSTRTMRGGAAGMPGGLSGDGVFVGCALAAQHPRDRDEAAQANECETRSGRSRRSAGTGKRGVHSLLTSPRLRRGATNADGSLAYRTGCVSFPAMLHPKRRIRPAPTREGIARRRRSDRQLLQRLQQRALARGLPDLRPHDRRRHDDRPVDRGRADAGRAVVGAGAADAGGLHRLHVVDGREPLPRPALRPRPAALPRPARRRDRARRTWRCARTASSASTTCCSRPTSSTRPTSGSTA